MKKKAENKAKVVAQLPAHILEGIGDPTGEVDPPHLGTIYIDTQSKVAFMAFGTDKTDWKKINISN